MSDCSPEVFPIVGNVQEPVLATKVWPWPYIPEQSWGVLTPIFRTLGVADEVTEVFPVLMAPVREDMKTSADMAVVDVMRLTGTLRSSHNRECGTLGRLSYGQFASDMRNFQPAAADAILNAVATSVCLRESHIPGFEDRESKIAGKVCGTVERGMRRVAPSVDAQRRAAMVTRKFPLLHPGITHELESVILPAHDEHRDETLARYDAADERRSAFKRPHAERVWRSAPFV